MSKKVRLLPCIFGDHISNNCPVRQALSKPAQDEISKHIQPLLEGMPPALAEVFETFKSLFEGEITRLGQFCQCCPYLKRPK